MYFKYIRLKNLKSLFLMTEAFCEKGSDKYILPIHKFIPSLYVESIEFNFEAIIIIIDNKNDAKFILYSRSSFFIPMYPIR